jgi:hypothetical protein
MELAIDSQISHQVSALRNGGALIPITTLPLIFWRWPSILPIENSPKMAIQKEYLHANIVVFTWAIDSRFAVAVFRSCKHAAVRVAWGHESEWCGMERKIRASALTAASTAIRAS